MIGPGMDVPLALWGGAECTINRVGDHFKDQTISSGHDVRANDLDRFAGLGITAIRYPLLWESFELCHDREQLWEWHDERLARLRGRGVRPILGLVHHGSGPRATNLLVPDFAAGLAQHAAEAAGRYPWVQDWTPVNEPLTTARFSALYGLWYPHLRNETAFWLALVNQIDAVRAAMSAVRSINPGARLIQTEDLGYTNSTPERAGQAAYYNLRRWASWDLLTGKFSKDHGLMGRIADMGLGERLEAISADPCPPDLLGLNHYLTSDRFLDHRLELYPESAHGGSAYGPLADVEAVRVDKPFPGLDGALQDCWNRYRIPMALTEVHNGCTREEQMRWLKDAWETAERLRTEGLAIEAVTVWSLLGAYDWDSLLTRNAGNYESGVFDVRGGAARETALAPMIRTIAAGRTPDHPVLGTPGWWRRGAQHRMSLVSGNRGNPRPLLIVGATGTLGQAFAGACNLRAIDHVLTGRGTLDLRDNATMCRALNELRPWAVINCAGWVRVDDAEDNPEECLAANFTGNVSLAAACRQRDIHYTCFSSDMVFDGSSDRAYVESDAPIPLNIYGLSKARADAALQEANGRALIVRTASFFSPFDNHNFAVHLVAALRSDRMFRAAKDCITSPTYVPDLVRTTLDLVIDDEVGLWHLVNQGGISWAEFAVEIGSAMKLRSELIDKQPIGAMGWTARRPRHAPITSERSLIMPTLESAIERFAWEFRKRDADSPALDLRKEKSHAAAAG